MTRYSNTMSEILAGIREGYSPKEIKMAIGVATDKRYKGGNMTGAVNAIEKIKKGLSKHPQVSAVLKRVNENDEPASPDEGSMAMDQLEFMKYAAEEIMQHIQNGGEFPEWMQNKLSGTHEKMKSLHANINHDNVQDQKEEVELDEAAPKISTGKAKGSISATGLRGKGMKRFDVDVSVKNGKFEFRITDEQGKFQTVNIKQAARMLGEEVVVTETKDMDEMCCKNCGDMFGRPTAESSCTYDAYDPMGENWIKQENYHEGKSSTGYELYHKDFSSAMKHAYDFAKKKFGIEVDPKEIDDKVASGPRKPSKGKTNSYRLLGKDGKKAIQVQVYGMDNGKYELNMYKEETMKEAALMIAEKLKVSDGLGAWITDFQKSDAPQFAGKSDEQKKKMAIAAFVDAGGKLGEETIDENMKRVAKELEDYARKNGGIDKMDFMKAAMMMKKGQTKQLMKFVDDLDTEPREKILSLIDKDSERRKEYKAFQKMKRNEGLNEEEEPQKPDSAKAVEQGREDKKKTRIAQLQLQIAKAQETINKLNAQEKPSE